MRPADIDIPKGIPLSQTSQQATGDHSARQRGYTALVRFKSDYEIMTVVAEKNELNGGVSPTDRT